MSRNNWSAMKAFVKSSKGTLMRIMGSKRRRRRRRGKRRKEMMLAS